MGRPAIRASKFHRAAALHAAGARIDDACREVRISRASFYRHRAKASNSQYPAIEQNCKELAASFSPRRFGRLKPLDLRNLRLETADIFRRTFGRHGRTRTSKQLADELDRFLRDVKRVVQRYNQLDSDLINQIDDLKELYPELAGLIGPAIKRLSDYLKPLEDRIRDLRRAGRVGKADRGGRRTDPRVLTVTVGLARIFAAYARKIPTHRTSPATGRSVSDFNRFARAAFDHFLPVGTVVTHALREAMRQAAARVDWSDEATSQSR